VVSLLLVFSILFTCGSSQFWTAKIYNSTTCETGFEYQIRSVPVGCYKGGPDYDKIVCPGPYVLSYQCQQDSTCGSGCLSPGNFSTNTCNNQAKSVCSSTDTAPELDGRDWVYFAEFSDYQCGGVAYSKTWYSMKDYCVQIFAGEFNNPWVTYKCINGVPREYNCGQDDTCSNCTQSFLQTTCQSSSNFDRGYYYGCDMRGPQVEYVLEKRFNNNCTNNSQLIEVIEYKAGCTNLQGTGNQFNSFTCLNQKKKTSSFKNMS